MENMTAKANCGHYPGCRTGGGRTPDGMRGELVERVRGNYRQYVSGLAALGKNEIIDKSCETASMGDALAFIEGYGGFHDEEIEALLQHGNPLKLLADAFEGICQTQEMHVLRMDALSEVAHDGDTDDWQLIPE